MSGTPPWRRREEPRSRSRPRRGDARRLREAEQAATRRAEYEARKWAEDADLELRRHDCLLADEWTEESDEEMPASAGAQTDVWELLNDQHAASSSSGPAVAGSAAEGADVVAKAKKKPRVAEPTETAYLDKEVIKLRLLQWMSRVRHLTRRWR